MAENRKLETPEQANNQKKIAAEKMAKKRKLETPEHANIQKRKDAEKKAEKRKYSEKKSCRKTGRRAKIGDIATTSKKD
jgi:hypothetical protein